MVIGMDGDRVARARLALGSVGPTVVLSEAFAEALVGNQLSSESIAVAAHAAADAVAPISDGRATAAYRSSVLATVIKRALTSIEAGTHTERWSSTTPTLSSDEELSIAPLPPRPSIDAETPVAIVANGRQVLAPAGGASLLDWIRDRGRADRHVKEGCAEGECGACTVLLDGAAVMSCLVSAAQADGRSVTTVEGLADGEALASSAGVFCRRVRGAVWILYPWISRRRRPAARESTLAQPGRSRARSVAIFAAAPATTR